MSNPKCLELIFLPSRGAPDRELAVTLLAPIICKIWLAEQKAIFRKQQIKARNYVNRTLQQGVSSMQYAIDELSSDRG